MAEVNQSSRPHILILGGTGFLGRQIAETAVGEGFRVSVFGRTPPTSASFEFAKIVVEKAGDKYSVRTAPTNVDVIVNTLACYGRGGEDAKELDYVNCELPAAIAKHYFSTSSQKHPSLFLNVDTALNSKVSEYARTKGAFRNELIALANTVAPIVSVRLDQFYGPGDAKSKFITMLINKFLESAEVIPLSSGKQSRRFLYSSDAVGALMRIVHEALARKLRFSKDSAAILPHLGIESSVRDVVLMAQKICGAQATRLDFGSMPDRGIETDDRHVPSGFDFIEQGPFVGIEDGIKLVVEFERTK